MAVPHDVRHIKGMKLRLENRIGHSSAEFVRLWRRLTPMRQTTAKSSVACRLHGKAGWHSEWWWAGRSAVIGGHRSIPNKQIVAVPYTGIAAKESTLFRIQGKGACRIARIRKP
jgi:hypothetical protein